MKKTRSIETPSIRHGHVFSPPSRAYNAWVDGHLDIGAMNQREAGKFFPREEIGLTDPLAPTDVPSGPAFPPPDGQLASAGQPTGRFLDEPGTHWKKHEVTSGEVLVVSWGYAENYNHRTRRWKYFITKNDWCPEQVLSRAQFDPIPFYQVELGYQPYWQYSEELKPPVPTVHEVPLPRKEGYHVLYAVWEIADTGAAFYHVIDLNFSGEDGGGERPVTPKNLKADDIKERSVRLSWDHSESLLPVEKYVITRDGVTTIDIPASQLSWTDTGVVPSGEYTYFITAVGFNGQESLPSPAIKVQTLNDDGTAQPPSPPPNLHDMGVTESSVSLMWGASTGHNSIRSYHIYRNGAEISDVPGTETTYNDNGLMANTEYSYYVTAKDSAGLTSPSSNVHVVKTKSSDDPASWNPNGIFYKVDDKVSFENHVYSCFQAHRSQPDWSPKETNDILWKRQGQKKSGS